MCKALHGIIALPFSSAVVIPYFNCCTQILQWGQWVNLSVTWDYEGFRNCVMWESGERTEVAQILKRRFWAVSRPSSEPLSLSVEVLFLWRVMGRNLNERCIYRQCQYSCQCRIRSKTWICCLIFHLYILFHHLLISRTSSPVPDGKNGFCIVFWLFRDIWNVTLVHHH